VKTNYSIAIRAAVKAGKAILEVYGSGHFDIRTKPDRSPLTIADRRAHDIIVEHLRETALPVLSEEGQQASYDVRNRWKQFWLVDPLDGTREFINRNGEFTVNIALVEEGKAMFGVVYAPVINELYAGIPGTGAFRCSIEKNFTEPLDYMIRFAEPLPLERSSQEHFKVVASRSHYNDETRRYVESIDSGGRGTILVNKGSSLKLCMVASGEADIYPRLGPTMEWDTAAAHAVVKASGKNVYHFDTGDELLYNKQNLLNPYFVVK